MDRFRLDAPTALLAVAIAASSALLLVLGSNLTFFQDTWAFLLERDGDLADRLLAPHNEHVVVIPAALQELAIEWFGAGSDMSSRIVLTAMLAGTALLLYVYVRRRVGPWPALFGATVLLFLGSGWENLLWPFQISLVGSMLAGLGMLLVLERGDRRGDLAACLLLTASIFCSTLGLSFAAGAAADVLLRGRERGWGRVWVVAAPVLLFGAWYLGYGREAESAVTLRNVLDSPVFVLESAAASVASILGLRALTGGLDGEVPMGPLIAVAALAAALGAWAWRREPALREGLSLRRHSPLWPAAATGLSFWFLAAFNEAGGRSPFAARYMYVGAVMVILIAAALFAGARVGRRALAVGAAITALAVTANVTLLLDGYDRFERESVLTRADLGALEIAAGTVAPDFRLDPETAGTPSLVNVSAGPYLELVAEHGSPAYDPAELVGAPEAGRIQADVVLSRALPVSSAAGGRGGSACRSSAGDGSAALPPGGGVLRLGAGPPATVALRRFAPADAGPVVIGEVRGGTAIALEIPRDSAGRPWMLSLTPERPVRICRLRASPPGT